MKKRTLSGALIFFFLSSIHYHQLVAQQSTVYASVLSTKLFVVGAANPNTGLYYQRPTEDTLWHHTGANRIRAFGVAADASSKGRTLYIAAGNGVHKTTDGGATWKITTGWEITEVQCVAPDPTNANVVYIATPYGVYKTTDGCATWKEKNTGISFPFFLQSIIIDHSDAKRLYCATEGGVYVSNDGAESWKRTGLNVGNARMVVQHPTDSKKLFVGTEDGIYSTPNGGRWWTKVESGIDHSTFYAITFDPVHPDTMYAGGYVTGVYKSVNGGGTWRRMNNGLDYLSIHSIAVDPANSNRVYAGTIWGGMYRSDNGGENWKSVGLPQAEVWTIVIQPY